MSKERKENAMSLVTIGLLCLRTNSQPLQDLQTSKGCSSLQEYFFGVPDSLFTRPAS